MPHICTWAGCTKIAEIDKTTKVSGRVYARLCRDHARALEAAERDPKRENRDHWMKALIKAIGFDERGRKV